ncbi:MAG: hypothetical protein KKA76_01375, partial [Proteobacteria bacterium]|nr:hypothetical protein [Pseudomonadota bacterium]
RHSQENDIHLASFQGELVKRLPGEARDKMLVDLEVDYGHLFSPSDHGYQGFGYFTAKVDSDNQLRLNSSLGHFLPVVDGELFLTHRLLRSNISSSLQNLGSIHDKVYENGFSANYTRYSDGFIKETSLNYCFIAIPGQEFAESVISLDPDGIGYTAKIIGGFSDTATHKIGAQIAFGSENMGFDFLTGFKTSMHFGYEHIVQDVFHDQPGRIMQSFSALATLEQQTSIGLIKTSYKHVESSQTLSVGYSFRGVELYVKNIQYKNRDDAQLYGVKIKFDLNNLGMAFRKKIKTLFRKPTYFYKDLHQRRHDTRINSDHLATRPTIRESMSFW